MSGHETLPFSACVRDASAGNLKVPKSKYQARGKYPVIDQGKKMIAGYIDDAEYLYKGQLPVVLFGDHTRILKYVDFPFCMGADGVKVLQPRPGLDAKYLYHYLRNVDIPNAGYSRHFKFLKQAEIAVPSPARQQQIVQLFDSIEAVRRRRQDAIELLETVPRSIFLDIFGNPESNPKGMDIEPLENVAKVKSGAFLPATAMSPAGEYPVYGGNGIAGYHDEYLFDSPRIVIGRVGAYCGCVHLSPARSWITDNALYVNEIKASVEVDYLYHALQQADLNQYASRSAQPLISGARIYGTKIIVPPKQLQSDFSAKIRHIDHLKTKHQAHLSQLDALLASAQDRSFRGNS